MEIIIEKEKMGFYDPIKVTFVPSKFERMLGAKEIIREYCDSATEYGIGGKIWLRYSDKSHFGSFPQLDKFLRGTITGQSNKQRMKFSRAEGPKSMLVLLPIILVTLTLLYFFQASLSKNMSIDFIDILLGSLFFIFSFFVFRSYMVNVRC